MSVVGFDFGNLNCYIAVARQGGIEVLINDYSLHATPSCVAFTGRGRTMGDAARQQLNTNLKNTVINFKHLLGRKFSDSISQKFRAYLPCEMVELPNDGIGLQVIYQGEKRVFTPEQVTAMLLVKLKSITESSAPEIKNVTDCVVSVPFYFTDVQRRALLTAVKISGLNSLRIVNETTAVALAYGIYKQDLPPEKEAPRLVVFLDCGHSATQATLVAFNKGKLAILANTYDLEVCGLEFDSLIRNYFAKIFKDVYKIDAVTNKRAWFRLLDECEKIKKQMSANSTAIPINIECFMDDKDVTAKIERSQFEEIAKPLFDRIRVLLDNLLAETGKKAADIDAVELIGGSSRIPEIRKIIVEIFSKEPKTTMNQDEAVARGSAMQCAILSPAFKVRDFTVKDCQPYRIKLSWGGINQSDGGENDVFVEHDEFPFSKMITLYRQEAFQLDASYAYPNLIPHPTRQIGTWLVKNVTPGVNGECRKIKIKVRVNPNGIFSVCSANAFETVEVKEPEVQPPAQPMETDEIKKEKDVKQKETKKNDAAKQNDAPIPASEMSKEDLPKNDSPDTTVENTKPKVKTISIDLPIEERIPYISNDENLLKMEKTMQSVDRFEQEKSDAKNSLEEYVYYMRSKLSDSFAEFITSEDAKNMQAILTEIENWLYDEGEDADKAVYEEKLNDIKKLGDPVQERFREFENRKNAFESFDRSIIRARKAYDEYAKGSEKYSHLESNEMEKVITAIEEKKKWIDEQFSRQQKRKKTEAPIVFVHQLLEEQQKFENIVSPILNKPKPVPPKKEAGKEKKDAANDEKSASIEALKSEEIVNSTNNAEMEVD